MTWVLAIILLDRTPKAQQQKQIQPSGGKISGVGDATKKKKQVGLHPIKNFCTAKEMMNKMKGQPTELEKIFAKP